MVTNIKIVIKIFLKTGRMEGSPLGLETIASCHMEEDTRVLSNLHRRSRRSMRGISRRSKTSRKNRDGRFC